jgi:hypothetical protein
MLYSLLLLRMFTYQKTALDVSSSQLHKSETSHRLLSISGYSLRKNEIESKAPCKPHSYPSIPTAFRSLPYQYPRWPVPYPANCKVNLQHYLESASSVISFVKILFICVETVARFPLFPAKITKFKLAKAPSICESPTFNRIMKRH